ncbi:ATPase domain-containing protein [Amorphus orientalis]|uniref:non-specific serine/threonine protein kinase n=1 Tax=Amorphus orientalis TaxID=649198 RepID=A0AAE3VMB1_9HYPH|nr:ATPase domain-containing protein [Amorphus orientalis]MDQ0314568.1 circadian clock protein KaiC [Amorphus orientalis]
MNGDIMQGKAATGMVGVDEILGGGLPRGRPTLVAGDAGAGKTIFCLQTLQHGAVSCGEPGLYLSLEEQSGELKRTVDAFDWGGASDDLHFHDALIDMDFETMGGFDLTGLIGILEHLCERHGIRRVVIDGIDTLLDRIEASAGAERELGRLLQWARRSDAVVLLTAKLKSRNGRFEDIYESMFFGADCALRLERRQTGRMSQRTLWVAKYRGSGHGENAYPFVISEKGITSLYLGPGMIPQPRGAREPVSTGVSGLDEMLKGGFPAGSVSLYTGAPGTAKTTLTGAFIEAACERGDRALLILFDEFGEHVVRHLNSVGIDLQPHIDSGLLRVEYVIGGSAGVDHHAASIRARIDEHRPDVIAIDPLSSLTKAFESDMAWPAVEYVLHAVRMSGATAVLTSLTEGGQDESSTAHVSTIADNWIHVAYGIRGAERNRVLTIVKARGVAHRNDVREMLLSDEGVVLADVYPIEGGMLTGSTRVARMRADLEHEQESRERGAESARRQAETRRGLLDELQRLQEELRRLDADTRKNGDEGRKLR